MVLERDAMALLFGCAKKGVRLDLLIF